MSEAESSYLDRILSAKRAELSASRRGSNLAGRDLEQAVAGLAPTVDFEMALRTGTAPRVIAEFKRASPSAGEIRPGAEVADIVRAYEAAGAAAISVLTDRHFNGSVDDLKAARAATSLPLLRKDFILERSQIVEARQAGADAVLLIAAALEPPRLKELIDFALDVGLAVLCEAHDLHEVDRALSAGATIVGVNNRDLRTFAVDVGLSVELRSKVPKTFTYVAESGIEGPAEMDRLREAGVDAVLVGSHLMRAEDPGEALRELIGS